MADKERNNESGSQFFGDRSRNFLKRMSREVVESLNNFTVLYFEVDYENSKRNFYGELVVRKFTNAKGIKVNGILKIEQGTDLSQGDIPNKITTLEFGCYLDHLKELGIQPKIGDYFSTKNRIYYIYDKTIADANLLSVNTDQEAIAIRYSCVMADSEQLTTPSIDDNLPTKNSIEGTSQTDGKANSQGY